MPETKQKKSLISAISSLKEDLALQIVRERLAARENPLDLITECQEAMNQVGRNYQSGKYFLSGLIMGGEIFHEATGLIKPYIEKRISGDSKGKILLGTVEGDIHDLGKNVVKILLNCHKFDVYDLGVDVPAAEFVKKARELEPDIVGLSGVVTFAFESMRDVVSGLRKEKIEVPVIIGGPQLSDDVRRYTEADYFVTDAIAGIEICKRLVLR